jgi:hypothetical protein
MKKLRIRNLAIAAIIATSIFCGGIAMADDYYYGSHPSTTLVLQAPGLSHHGLSQMHNPALVDKTSVFSEVRSLEREISEIERAAGAVRDSRLRGVLFAQIDRMKQRTKLLRRQLHRAKRVVTTQRAPVVVDKIGYVQHRACRSGTFESIRKTLRQTPFSDSRLDTLRHLAKRNYFSTTQAKELAMLFPFANEKIEALSILYPSVVDPQNYHIVLHQLPFSSQRKKLLKRIEAIDHL